MGVLVSTSGVYAVQASVVAQFWNKNNSLSLFQSFFFVVPIRRMRRDEPECG